MNVFDNAINAIKVNEMVGKDECIIPSTKLIKAVLEVLKANKYIADYEEFKENKIPKIDSFNLKRNNDKQGSQREASRRQAFGLCLLVDSHATD